VICTLARYRVKCDNPFCTNFFFADKALFRDPNLKFCRECKEGHSYQALSLQVKHKKPIKQVLIDATKLFHSAVNIADYLGISFPTFYRWLGVYFDMDFQSWKRQYICRAQRCCVLDISSMPIVYRYHVTETIKKNRACACFVAMGDQSLLVTSARPEKLRDIFRNAPEMVSDGTGINKIRYPVRFVNLYADELERSPKCQD